MEITGRNCHEIRAPSTSFCTEFHENGTKVLVAGAMSQTDRQTDGRALYIKRSILISKEGLITRALRLHYCLWIFN
jgi:hypothetical protein